jgi:hypothetical protein
MTPNLHPTLPIQQGESVTSFMSRLSWLNRIPSARDFCRLLGLRFAEIVDGCAAVLGRLEEIAGLPRDRLGQDAIMRRDRIISLRGQQLTKPILRRERVLVCPCCIIDDCARSSGPRELAAFGRTVWHVGPIRTCPTHGVFLVEVANSREIGHAYDFAHLLSPAIRDLRQLERRIAGCSPSALEIYLQNRLSGTVLGCWLDQFPFYAAGKIGEMCGAMAVFGSDSNLKKLTEADWQTCGTPGYEIAAGGAKSIQSLLTDLRDARPARYAAKDGPRARYGSFYEWLDSTSDPAYDPLKHVVREHIIDTTAFGLGDVVLGAQITRRRNHSIYTVQRDFGLHPQRFRRILLAEGLIQSSPVHVVDHNVIVPVEILRPLLAQIDTLKSVPEVRAYIGAGRVQTDLLIAAGYLSPWGSRKPDTKLLDMYSTRDLDAFLERLLRNAVRAKPVPLRRVDIPEAASRTCCSAMDIVKFIMEGKLNWVGRNPASHGYTSVLVDIEEVNRALNRPTLDGHPCAVVAKRLKTSRHVVSKLMDKGLIPSKAVSHPRNKYPLHVVSDRAIEDFRRRYCSLVELCGKLRCTTFVAAEKMRAAGIKPAIGRAECGATFYKRHEINKL